MKSKMKWTNIIIWSSNVAFGGDMY